MRTLATLLERWRADRRRRRAIAELHGYDDRLLDDLGIERAEIGAYVDGRLDREERDDRPGAAAVIDLAAYRRCGVLRAPRRDADAA